MYKNNFTFVDVCCVFTLSQIGEVLTLHKVTVFLIQSPIALDLREDQKVMKKVSKRDSTSCEMQL